MLSICVVLLARMLLAFVENALNSYTGCPVMGLQCIAIMLSTILCASTLAVNGEH